MVFQYLIECLRQNVSFIASVIHDKQEIEVVCLFSMLIVSLGDNSHDTFVCTFQLLYQSHLASQIHNRANFDRLKK